MGMKLDDIAEIVANADIMHTALGNVVMVFSPNGIHTRCVCVSSEGEIVQDLTIASEDIEFIPSAKQFANWVECWSDLYNFYTAMAEGILIK